MKHGRSDYDEHIQAPEGMIPEDEPVFLLRASDMTAPDVVNLWAMRAEAAGADEQVVASARKQAEAMRAWQLANGAELADLPKQELNVPIRSAEETVAACIGPTEFGAEAAEA